MESQSEEEDEDKTAIEVFFFLRVVCVKYLRYNAYNFNYTVSSIRITKKTRILWLNSTKYRTNLLLPIRILKIIT